MEKGTERASEWASVSVSVSVSEQALVTAQAQAGAPGSVAALGQAEAAEPEEVLEPVRVPVRVPGLARGPASELEWELASAEGPESEWAPARRAAWISAELPALEFPLLISADLLRRNREEA
jgi:hypothetical protein